MPTGFPAASARPRRVPPDDVTPRSADPEGVDAPLEAGPPPHSDASALETAGDAEREAEREAAREAARARNAESDNPRAIETRRRLIDAVMELAAELEEDPGREALTPAAVSRRAGVSASSFHAHYEGVADLALAALRANLQSLDADYRARAANSEDGVLGPHDRRAVYASIFAKFDRVRGLILAAFGPGGDGRRMIEEYRGIVEAAVRRDAPGLPEHLVPPVSSFLAGGALVLYVAHPSAEEREAVLDTVVAHVPRVGDEGAQEPGFGWASAARTSQDGPVPSSADGRGVG